MRRSKALLEQRIKEAKTPSKKAKAHYDLGVFHDNNSREHEAIPHYREALRLGLDRETKAKCLAWLASSLYKTGRPEEGIRRCNEAMKATKDPAFKKWLERLAQRIHRSGGMP